ncbi:protein-tyrosine phosphatase-like protein [Vibrio phage vB_ValS_PJ32]|nr:protein-tyrosine phosphatase-like protein [Vibrio phage vB_ValS_PJ32]
MINVLNKLLNRFYYFVGAIMYKNELPPVKDGRYHGYMTVINIEDGLAFTLYGGSYLDRVKGVPGIKLAAEVDHPCDYELAIPDFSTPTEREVALLIDWIINTTRDNYELYLGCWGGFGRTGLIAACILVALEEQDPLDAIVRVRREIHGHCIETHEQRNFIVRFADLVNANGGIRPLIDLAKEQLI